MSLGASSSSDNTFNSCVEDCRKFSNVLERVMRNCTGVATDVAKLRAELGEGEELDEWVKEGEVYLKELVELNMIIANTKQVLRSGGLSASLEDDDTDLLGESLEQQVQKPSQSEISNHQMVRGFQEAIQTAISNVNEEEEEEEDEEEEMEEHVNGEGDEELAVGRVQKSTICPLTRKLFEEPVRSTQCGHTYSKEAIHAHVQHSQSRHHGVQRCRCPVGGCPALVELHLLVRDEEMERLVDQEKRKKHRTRRDRRR